MKAASIGDLRTLARKRLPRVLFDMVDGAAFSEKTHAENGRAFDDFWLQQRALRGVSSVNLEVRLATGVANMPIILAPIGLAGLLAARGEIQACEAASQAGIPACLSTFSVCTIEDVAKSAAPPWFQLYLLNDRSIAEDLLRRAAAAGSNTVILTVDSAVGSIRERDVRNGIAATSRLSLATLFDLLTHARWALDHVRCPPRKLGNLPHDFAPGASLLGQVARAASQIDRSIGWTDVAWLRRNWKGQLLLKGILNPADAVEALAMGADGIIVSNHGGRQLDGAAPSIRMLPHIRKAVGPDATVYLDGGVTRGNHVLKALAKGADAVLIGRAYAYGLGAAGKAGVTDALTMLRREMEVTMSLMGIASVEELKAEAAELIYSKQPDCGTPD